MNIKLWIIIICIILIYSIYYDYNIFKYAKNYKKYYKIGLIIIMGLGAITIMNKSPKLGYENMSTLNHFIQLMPIDKHSKDMMTPFFNSYKNTNYPQQSINRIVNSGKKSNKRSVSETKKKYIASNQNWKCSKCKQQLSAWFEVDHKIRLEHGGTNDVSNLEALCRECHGEKTAMENL